MWLFPFGAGPDPGHPIQMFRNGLSMWMGEEVRIVSVGEARPILVAVLEVPTRDGDVIQATYVSAHGRVG